MIGRLEPVWVFHPLLWPSGLNTDYSMVVKMGDLYSLSIRTFYSALETDVEV